MSLMYLVEGEKITNICDSFLCARCTAVSASHVLCHYMLDYNTGTFIIPVTGKKIDNCQNSHSQ